MGLPEQLSTERLNLRPLRPEDAEAVFEGWASKTEVPRWMVWSRHQSVDDARRFLEWVAETNANGASRDWMILAPPAGEPVGTIGLRTLSSFSYELGYVLAPSAWGRGFATEAVRAVTEAAFALEDTARVQAHCHPDNAASLRVLEKCGYEREGLLRRCQLLPNISDEPQDLFLFSRVR